MKCDYFCDFKYCDILKDLVTLKCELPTNNTNMCLSVWEFARPTSQNEEDKSYIKKIEAKRDFNDFTRSTRVKNCLLHQKKKFFLALVQTLVGMSLSLSSPPLLPRPNFVVRDLPFSCEITAKENLGREKKICFFTHAKKTKQIWFKCRRNKWFFWELVESPADCLIELPFSCSSWQQQQQKRQRRR